MQAAASHAPDRGSSFLWVALLPLAGFIALVWGLLNQPLPWRGGWAWVPSLGVEFAVYIDGWSAQFLALITGIGTLVFVYASGYLAHEPRRGRLFLILTVFVLAMAGAVSADHLLILFLCWELTSLTSFLLVGFHHEEEGCRAAARQALLVTLSGGLALLAAFLLLGDIAGSNSLQAIIAQGPALADDPRLPAALILLFVGCFTKSAQFPFHFWLPNAMTAPTPVSAYLHSATYDGLLKGLPRVAAWQTRALQHGRLAGYLRGTLASLLILGAGAGLATGMDLTEDWARWVRDWTMTGGDWPQQGWAWLAAALIVAGAAASAATKAGTLALATFALGAGLIAAEPGWTVRLLLLVTLLLITLPLASHALARAALREAKGRSVSLNDSEVTR